MPNKETLPEIQVPGTLDQLVAALNRSSTDNALALASALRDIIKPPESDGEKANKEAARLSTLKNINREIRSKEAAYASCEHLQGTTLGVPGESTNGRGAFAVLRLGTGEVVGICQVCHKEISSLRPEDAHWFRKRGGVAAEAGQFVTNEDPLTAQLARFSEDEAEEIRKSRTKKPLKKAA